MATTWFVSFFFLSYSELALAALCFTLIYIYYQSLKKSIVPVNWPGVGMLPGLLINLNRFHDWITDILHESNGTFKISGPWFLGFDFLLTSDPANVNHVFNANFSNYPKGEEFLDRFDILGEGIFNADDVSWKNQRKKAHAAISNPNFRAFLARCSKEKVEDALIPLLNKFAEEKLVVDLQDVFLRLTFDMTCNLVFGVDPGCLSEGLPAIPFASAMDDAMVTIFLRHMLPTPWWKLMRWLRIGNEKKLSRAWQVMDDFVAENIAKREQEIFSGEDLLSAYIGEDSNLGSGDNNKFLRDTAVNLMLAGRDTTGVALAWFFWLLAKHPEVKSKIIDELSECFIKKNTELSKLVYLHAALCESLRLFPSVPYEHKSPLQTEDLPSGTRVLSKDKIYFSMFSMGRMKWVWGEDCLEFKPERWISERGKVKHEPSYKFLSFNCGPRTCLGKEIAFTQMKHVVAGMLWNFEVELVEGNVVEPSLSIILRMKNGLLVRVKKRNQV